jgi:hypothetical protein
MGNALSCIKSKKKKQATQQDGKHSETGRSTARDLNLANKLDKLPLENEESSNMIDGTRNKVKIVKIPSTGSNLSPTIQNNLNRDVDQRSTARERSSGLH